MPTKRTQQSPANLETQVDTQEIASAEIKGSMFPLSVLHLDTNDLTIVDQQLNKKLAAAKDFFYRAPLIINIEQVADQSLDFAALKKLVEVHDFVCVGISHASKEHKVLVQQAGMAVVTQSKATKVDLLTTASDESTDVESGLRVDNSASEFEKSGHLSDDKQPQESLVNAHLSYEVPGFKSAKVIRQNIRSGQQVYAKESDLIVVGTVSHGAEVIADGNIHIYGSLRGRAIAGASGEQNAAIYCHCLEAELVSIAGTYWLSDALPKELWKQSAVVRLEQEQLTIDKL
ncbi:septum site-determining protein MinC [Aliikangiella maris]|uniref:Septum site-determining protein MinC n=2 Tax=Aliikangiella maris TaxID=3162458 RepID=A0ABV3MST0_9GAMM